MAITVDGTEYSSWDDVPEEVRATLRGALPDGDGDGVPDILQGRGTPGQHVVRTMKIKVGDREYDSPDQLPPELRATLEAAGMFPAQAGAQSGAHAGAQSGVQAGADAAPQPPAAQIPPPVSTASASGPVVLNGVPVDPQAKKKHWWQRG